MKMIFLGTPMSVIPVLESLHELHKQNMIDLVAVVTQPPKPAGRGRKLVDTPVAIRAQELGIRVLQPKKASDEAFLAEMRELAPDLCLTAAYGQILTNEFLKIPRRATFNIHPSLLPRWRGATPVPATLLAGDEKTGVSLLFTVRKVDAGAIICQAKTEVAPEETAELLTNRLFQLGAQQLPEALRLLSDASFQGSEQDDSAVTHCGKIDKTDGQINWNVSSTEILRKYRAYQPWPGVYTFHKGKRVALGDLCAGDLEGQEMLPGSLTFDKATKELKVVCGDGSIKIDALKREGSGWKSAADFWNGLNPQKGARFDTE